MIPIIFDFESFIEAVEVCRSNQLSLRTSCKECGSSIVSSCSTFGVSPCFHTARPHSSRASLSWWLSAAISAQHGTPLMGNLCLRTPSRPGLDFLKGVLQSDLPITQSFFLSPLLSQVSDLHHGLKTLPIMPAASSLNSSQVFLPRNLLHDSFHLGTCFLEDSSQHKFLIW